MEDEGYHISQVSKYIFEFPSIGKKHLLKQVRFTETKYDSDIYNLALGTVLKNGKVDFFDSSNNGDVTKVFGTVVNCIKIFSGYFPGKIIFFKGNTEQKTKVYNEILRRHYDEFSIDFYIFGVSAKDGIVRKFDVSEHYSGFLLRRNLKREK